MGVPPVREGRHGFRVIDALNVEWDRLVESTDPMVLGWGRRHPALHGCRDLAAVVDAARATSDAVLGALLAEHATGCSIAGRTVLQVLLGRAVGMAVRDQGSEVGDYVAAMWCHIRTYPLAERPTSIAANIGLDSLKAVKSERQWTRQRVAVTILSHGSSLEEAQLLEQTRAVYHHQDDADQLTARGVISAADRLGLIDAGTRAVLLSVYSDGLSGRAAARVHETSPEMIRYRCSRAVRRLSEHASLLAEAA